MTRARDRRSPARRRAKEHPTATMRRTLAALGLSCLLSSALTALPHPAHAQGSTRCTTTGLSSPAILPEPSIAEKTLNYRRAWPLSTGEGITVAVIDTGVATHPRLGEVAAGTDFTGGDDAHWDCDAHGTFVAGILAARPGPDGFAGVAPGANIVSIKQTGQDNGTLETLAAAIYAALEHGAHIINISVVLCTRPGFIPLGGESVAKAVAAAEAAGVLIVAASGNLGSATNSCDKDSVSWPAILPEVLAVTAVEFDDAGHPIPAPYAVTGQWVALAAPGGPIIGPDPNNPQALANLYTSEYHDQGAPIQGTSFAAPVVSATAALVKARHPELSPTQLRQVLAESATPLPAVHGMGVGIVDPYAALSWVSAQEPGAADPLATAELGRHWPPAPATQLAAPKPKPAVETQPAGRAQGLILLLALGIGGWLLLRLARR